MFNAIAPLLAAMLSPAQKMQHARGKAPPGKRWTSASVYYPKAANPVKNPKIAAHVQMMYEKWYAKKWPIPGNL